ncbi:GNAT family N-acetyltransferase [Pedobacter cryophilus]|uniref:GNAT family N-acetyltransferase n=1 Tax=Pedobacter cryophilus TaxID=2571271 RepID=A0A4U1C156_9SPHI|nr:GNAT family N-acetyltransferase [Pedobacter cryophilus]TKB97613.1 GNAT family N-acetyltransferase [Pedobacter cryophilus]
MNYSIYLRPLNLEDAETSYRWRNNPEIWNFTEFKPNKHITVEIETEWLYRILQNKDEYRFAICLKETGQYLGNVQLLNVNNKTACFHIFIGETSFWGKGIGNKATALLLEHGFNNLKLDFITLRVHKDNSFALSVYKKMGFQIIDKNGDFMEMALAKDYYYRLQKLSRLQKTTLQKPDLIKS